MSRIVISCKAADWQNVMRANLRDGLEVDLINFDHLHIPLCEALAHAHGLIFKFCAAADSGHFFKGTILN